MAAYREYMQKFYLVLLIVFCGRTYHVSSQRSPAKPALTARSYNSFSTNNEVRNPGPTNDYQSSAVSIPLVRNGNSENMNFQLPGAPRPPEPPAFGGGSGGFNYPFLPFGPFGANGGGGGGNGGYENGGGMSYPGNGGGNAYGNNNGWGGNTGDNQNAQGSTVNGYRPSPTIGSTNTAANEATNYNVENGFIVRNHNNAGSQESDYGHGDGYGSSAYTARKNCRPESYPANQGYCALRNQLKRKCKTLTSAYSSDCSGKELCCFDPADVVVTTTAVPVTTTPPPPVSTDTTLVTAQLTTSTTTNEPVFLEPRTDRYCVPDSNPDANGICFLETELSSKCAYSVASASTNCLNGEKCCYPGLPGQQLTSATTTAQTSPPSTTSTLPTLTSTTSQVATTDTTTAVPKFCSPGSYQSITNGVCTPTSMLAPSCKGRQISPSLDCGYNQYCCFIADSPNGGLNLPPGSCSPATNPAILNGICVDAGTISNVCAVLQVATSLNCASEQLCCYSPAPPTTTTVATTATTPTTVSTIGTTVSVSSTNPTTSSSYTTPLTHMTTQTAGGICRPGRPPGFLPNGTCVTRPQLTAQCKGIQIDYSLDCGYLEYCCYTHGSSGVIGLAPATIAPGSCTPESNRQVNNGFCVTNEQLSTRCMGILASTSVNCASNEYCCYSADGLSSQNTKPPTQATGMGYPGGYSSMTTGKGSSTAGSNMGTTSGGMTGNTTPRTVTPSESTVTSFASTLSWPGYTFATNYGGTAAYMFSSTPGTGSTMSTGTPVTTTGSTIGKTCSPEDYNNYVTGKCVSIASSQPQCVGMQASPSLNCSIGEYCCFSNPIAPPLIYLSGGGSPCTPENMPEVNTGICTEWYQLPTMCAAHEVSTSLQCDIGQLCCYKITGTGSSTISSITTTQNLGGTTAVMPSMTSTTTSNSVTTTVTQSPEHANQTYGYIAHSTGMSIIPIDTITSTTSPTLGGPCSPQGYPNAHDGFCTSVFKLSLECAGKQAAPSLKCGLYEYCCFKTPVAPAGTVLAPAGFCTPEINPSVSNGICVETALIATSCNSHDISWSISCNLSQLCCFNANGDPIAGSTGTTTEMTITGQYPQGTDTAPNFMATPPMSSTMTSRSATPGQQSTGDQVNTVTAGSTQTAISPVPGGSTVVGSATTMYSTGAHQYKGGNNGGQSVNLKIVRVPPGGGTGTISNGQTGAGQPQNGLQFSGNDPSFLGNQAGLNGHPSSGDQIFIADQNQGGNKQSTGGQGGFNQNSGSNTASNGQATINKQNGLSGLSGYRVCQPASDPSVRNGYCLDISELNTKCAGGMISGSAKCDAYKFCCYGVMQNSSPTPVTASTDNPLSPATTNINNGTPQTATPVTTTAGALTTTTTVLPTSISGPATSTTTSVVYTSASNTLPNDNGNYNSGYGYTTAPVSPNKISLNRARSCAPMTAPWVKGSCVLLKQLTLSCRSQRISKSPDCTSDEYCCFADDASLNTVAALNANRDTMNTGCIPKTQPTVTDGICVTANQLVARCRTLRMAKSDLCGLDQLCCFNASSINRVQQTPTVGGILCSPLTDPSVNHGMCTPLTQMSVLCKGMAVAKSSGCPPNNFCCFDRSRPNTKQAVGRPCRPSTQPDITNGSCTDVDKVSIQCSQQSLAKSGDCANHQFCCFTGDNTQLSNTNAEFTACSPRTSPQISNGQCISTERITSQCQGKRVSRSDSCAPNQFCCFEDIEAFKITDTSEQLADPTSGNCRPNSQPEFKNGLCVDPGQLATRCQAVSFSKSRDCKAVQFCCFSSNVRNPPAENFNRLVTPCSPNTAPQIINGKCVRTDILSIQCRGMKLAKSSECASNQFCCFEDDESSNKANVSTQVAGSASPNCRPDSQPDIQTGSCIDPGQLVARCQALSFSKSRDCNAAQFCCFSNSQKAPAENSKRLVTSCIPNTAPRITNGKCVDDDVLSVQCRGMKLTISAGCASNQFCCFEDGEMLNVTGISEQLAGTPTENCRPISQPDIRNGLCIDSSQLIARCRTMSFSKSRDCRATQFCCFSSDSQNTPAENPNRILAPCIPNTAPRVTNGKCVNTDILSVQCRGMKLAKSAGCAPEQFCCFIEDDNTGALQPSQLKVKGHDQPLGRKCSPRTQPDIHNGTCVDQMLLTSQCREATFSKSDDCLSTQFCCFGQTDILPVEKAKEGCAPDTDPEITTGSCVGLSLLTTRCRGRRMSKSRQCNPSQFCCFERKFDEPVPAVSKSTSTCSPKTNPNVLDGTCVVFGMLGEKCRGQRLAKSRDCTDKEFCCFSDPTIPPLEAVPIKTTVACTPLSDLAVNNGVCTERSELGLICRNQKFSKSFNCGPSQFCCFRGSDMDTNQKGGIPAPMQTGANPGLKSCTPTTDPSITTGACVSSADAQNHCNGRRISRSNDCSPDEACCFDTASSSSPPPNNVSINSAPACSPNTDRTITNGVCLNVEEVNSRCQGRRLGKSSDCFVPQFCCFDAVKQKENNAAVRCSDNNIPSNSNGVCMNFDRLSAECQGGKAFKSEQCPLQQFCCVAPGIPAMKLESENPSASLVKACTPNSEPGVVNGVCIERSQLLSQCQGQKLSKSDSCSSSQFCCFSTPPEPEQALNKIKPASGNPCTPQGTMDINDGVCLNLNDLTSRCKGNFFAKSGHCDPSQFCCFSRPVEEKVSPNTVSIPAQCSPSSDPSIIGQCIHQSQLVAQCQGQRMSKNDRCSPNHFCCFTSENATPNPPFLPGMCSPVSDPGVMDGICLRQEELVSNCRGQRFSKSENCRGDQFCCFSRPSESSINRITFGNQTSSGCRPNSSPSINNGRCLERSLVAVQCQGKRLSKSDDCNPSQFCCFDVEIVKEAQKPISAVASSCTPNSDPNVHDGVCFPRTELPVQCRGQSVSKSVNCGSEEFCCFSRQPNCAPSQKESPVQPGACRPNSDPNVTNGVCLNTDRITADCSGQRLAKSSDCSPSQFCCFGPINNMRSCTPNTDLSVGNGICTDRMMLSSQCQGKLASKSANCSSDQFCCFGRPMEVGVQPGLAVALTSLTSCRPINEPSGTEGLCMDGERIASDCVNRRLAKSTDCAENQSCCFSPVSSGFPCTPNSDISIKNGNCMEKNQLISQCQGKLASKSPNCSSSQFCCFARPSEAINTNPSIDPARSRSGCTPNSDLSVTSGTCTEKKLLITECKGKLASKSMNCTSDQYCCFVRPSQPDSQKVVAAALTSLASCRPLTDPSATDGVCLEFTQLASGCHNQRASRSADCPRNQWCCFGTTVSEEKVTEVTDRPTGSIDGHPTTPGSDQTSEVSTCSPSSDPFIANGFCLFPRQLSSRCQGRSFSKSPHCSDNQFCCFDRHADSGSANEHKLASTTCSPVNDFTITDGKCLFASELSTQCNEKSFTKSPNCTTTQFCCFQRPAELIAPSPSIACTPSSNPDVNNGLCTGVSELASQCSGQILSKSNNCSENQFCCFKTSQVDQKLAPENCVPFSEPAARGRCVSLHRLKMECNAATLGKSENCDSGQFCCFNRTKEMVDKISAVGDGLAISGEGGERCSPATDARVHDGLCVHPTQLASRCSARTFSKSKDCKQGHFCCFGNFGDRDKNIDSTQSSTGRCRPQNSPAVSDGLCVDADQRNNSCADRLVSASSDCRPDQLCCFKATAGAGTVSENGCSPSTESAITNGQCVSRDQLIAQCSSMTFSRSSSCQLGQFCCFNSQRPLVKISTQVEGACTPSTEPDVHNGACTDTNQLSAQCEGRRFSRSSDCANDQFCCFGEISSSQTKSQNSLVCTPVTEPSVNTGSCVDLGDLSAKCRDKIFARSDDCGGSEFCCFEPMSNKEQSTEISCVPNSDQAAENGVCVHREQLTSRCQGQRFSKSAACGDAQMCCFDSEQVSATIPQGKCVPLLNSTALGKCVDRGQLADQCRAITFSKSAHCSPSEFCCFDRQVSANGLSGISGSRLGTCSPSTDAGVKNGWCADRTELVTQCQNARFSKSSGCSEDQWCCFNQNTPSRTAERKSCSPVVDATITNGSCVNKNRLIDQCFDMSFARSVDCQLGQMCCYHRKDSPQFLDKTLCTPLTDATIHDGTCLDRDDLSPKCSGKVFAKSINCSSDQFCCFENPAASKITITIPGTCIPHTEPSVINGVCNDIGNLESRCQNQRLAKSDNCGENQFCCFNSPQGDGFSEMKTIPSDNSCIPSSNPSVNDGICKSAVDLTVACAGKRFSKSPNCGAGKFCCFTPEPSEEKEQPPVSPNCIPNSDLSVNNGKCVAVMNLGIQCRDLSFAKSKNCDKDLFCCFNRSIPGSVVEKTSVEPLPTSPGGVRCSPVTDPGVTNGSCLNREQLSLKCGTPQLFAKSSNCQPSEFCCFSRLEVSTPSPCVPATHPTVTNGQCIKSCDLATTCSALLISKSSNCSADEFCCFTDPALSKTKPTDSTSDVSCSPQSEPTVLNGVCTDKTDLGSRCRNQRVSKSSNCAKGQFCCFDGSNKLTNKFAQAAPLGNACIPSSSPGVSNGICRPSSELSSACAGQRFSKSENCESGQFCCFPLQQDDETVLVMPLACVPDSDLSVSNGKCVPMKDLETNCRGQTFSKSKNCGNDFCCFDRGDIFNKEQIAVDRKCKPVTDPNVSNGTCLNIIQLSQQCSGPRVFSKSSDCQASEFCCFSRPESLKTSGCSPITQPKVTNGNCVHPDELALKCGEMVFAKSHNCQAEQFCCFNSSSSDVDTKQASSGSSCIPSSDPSAVDGRCTEKKQLISLCGSQKFSKSADCSPEQFCCFGFLKLTQQLGGTRQCSPQTDPSITNGVCTPETLLTTQCNGRTISRSADCPRDQLCCFDRDIPNNELRKVSLLDGGGINSANLQVEPTSCRPVTEPDSNGICLNRDQLVSQCSGPKKFSKSTECQHSQFCCFSGVSIKSCTPSTDSSVSNGSCVEFDDLSSKCRNMTFSKSRHCEGNQFCCFTNSNGFEEGVKSTGSTCTPNTEPSVTSGTCTNPSDVTTLCRNSRLSKSIQCGNEQFCCFGGVQSNDVQPETSGNLCIPNSSRGITDGRCFNPNQLSAQCIGQRFSKSVNCAPSQFCCFGSDAIRDSMEARRGPFCIPNSDPTFASGRCVGVVDLESQCRDLSFSKSRNCDDDASFCCFNRTGTTGKKVAITQSMTCTPSSDPSVHNGICLTKNQLSPQCSTPRKFSKSADCQAADFCCFSGQELESTKCTPALRQDVSNGTCVTMDDLSQKCSNMAFSKSDNCPKEQFCCFESPDVQKQSGIGGVLCTPNTEPTTTNGTCTDVRELATLCQNQRLAKSIQCGEKQFCCFGEKPTTSKQVGRVCIPHSNGLVNNGRCFDSSQLDTSCKNQTFSKSDNCGEHQFCCFDPAASKNTAEKTGEDFCIPNSDLSLSNGHCLGLSELGSRCRDLSFAKSRNCRDGNTFCCFNSSGSSQVKIAFGTSRCTPSTDLSVHEGICLNKDQLTEKCNTPRRFSKSGECQASEFCCFGPESLLPSACTPVSRPEVNNGTCVSTTDLLSKCNKLPFSKSSDCADNQFCCFKDSGNKQSVENGATCTPNTDPATTDGKCTDTSELVTHCANQRISKSVDCDGNQFCCFGASKSTTAQETAKIKTGNVCIPNSDPTVNDGKCLDASTLASNCSGKRFSKSDNCGGSQFCCFDSNAAHGSSDELQGMQFCVPNSDPSLSSGHCMGLNDLNTKCRGSNFAKSRNCKGDQMFCCFNSSDTQMKIATAPATCTPSTDPSVHDGICLNKDQLSASCNTPRRFSKSNECHPSQFCCFGSESSVSSSCTPVTRPDIDNGTCVNTAELPLKCNQLPFSKSADCNDTQFCCFEERGQKLSVKNGAPCTPNTEPTTIDGKCMETTQLSVQCQNQRISKSVLCGDTQFCCFGGLQPTNQETLKIQTGNVCIPNSDPTVNSGKCLDPSQLASNCSGNRFSKSVNCGGNQFCCFESGAAKASSLESQGMPFCVPNSDLSLSNGQCMGLNDLNTRCRDLSFAKSRNCDGEARFCCFNSSATAVAITELNNKVAVEGTRCSPTTESSVHDGVCVSKGQLISRCSDQRFSKSNDCANDQFCCFGMNKAKDSSLESSCMPESAPEINNGQCVSTGLLQAQCSSKTFSRSQNCAADQMCCFDRAVIDKSSSNDTGAPLAPPDTISCTPNSDPTVTNGTCLKVRELAVFCTDRRASPSPDCPRFSWCCFDSPTAADASTSTAPPATTTTEAPVILVNPVRLDNLTPDPAAPPNSKLCSPNADPSIHNGFCATKSGLSRCSQLRLKVSKSGDCSSLDFCCFSGINSEKDIGLPVAATCTPNSDPSVHNGQCMKMRQLNAECVDRRAAPSSDCQIGQWCCFGESSGENDVLTTISTLSPVTLPSESTTRTSSLAPILTKETKGTCAPSKNKMIQNGECMTLRKLQSSCTDRQAGPSEDCAFGTWCCYTDPSMKIVDEVHPTIVPPASTNSDDSCIPNADPQVIDGQCMPTKDLRTRCRNQKVSKSPQCRLGHWCCFQNTLQRTNSTLESEDFSPIGRSLLGVL